MSQFTVAGKTGSAQTGPFSIPARDDQGKEIYENGVKKMIYFDPRTANLSWYQGGGDDGKTLSHAWFIGFAPAENPKIAFAVLVEYGGGGGAVAGPIAKRLLEACMEHGYLAPTPDGARTFSNED
jgi:cell division protein FtsI/penicillin-binding protein 2